MKIGSKLLLTYFIVLITAFSLTILFFNIFWNHYLVKEIETRLYEEGKTISSHLMDIGIKESNPEIAVEISKDQNINVFEKTIPYGIVIKDRVGNEVYKKTNRQNNGIMPDIMKGNFKGIEKAIVPITAQNGDIKGEILLYTQIKSFGQINKLIRLAQLFSLIFAGTISVVIVFVLRNYITKPIKILKEKMEQISLHNSQETDLDIHTGDELEELAKSFSNMANKLKQNNEQQIKMLQNMSHALKTPLMAIQGHTEAIIEGIVVGNEVRESLETIKQESQHLKKTIENIIYLYRMENVKESFHFETADLRTVIDNAIGNVKLTATKKGITIEVNCTDYCEGLFDGEKLEEAFVNILSNCIRYAETHIKINCVKENNIIFITIEDDGTGFKNNEDKLVFDRYYKGEKGNSGIGLDITRAIVEGHNGSISVRNGSDKGAVFEIKLLATVF